MKTLTEETSGMVLVKNSDAVFRCIVTCSLQCVTALCVYSSNITLVCILVVLLFVSYFDSITDCICQVGATLSCNPCSIAVYFVLCFLSIVAYYVPWWYVIVLHIVVYYVL